MKLDRGISIIIAFAICLTSRQVTATFPVFRAPPSAQFQQRVGLETLYRQCTEEARTGYQACAQANLTGAQATQAASAAAMAGGGPTTIPGMNQAMRIGLRAANMSTARVGQICAAAKTNCNRSCQTAQQRYDEAIQRIQADIQMYQQRIQIARANGTDDASAANRLQDAQGDLRASQTNRRNAAQVVRMCSRDLTHQVGQAAANTTAQTGAGLQNENLAASVATDPPAGTAVPSPSEIIREDLPPPTTPAPAEPSSSDSEFGWRDAAVIGGVGAAGVGLGLGLSGGGGGSGSSSGSSAGSNPCAEPSSATSANCQTHFISQCASNPSASGCSQFNSSHCASSGKGSSYCAMVSSRSYCATGASPNSPACKWMVEKQSACAQNPMGSQCLPSYPSQSAFQSECGKYPGDPLCNSSFASMIGRF